MGQRLTIVPDGLRQEWALTQAAKEQSLVAAHAFISFADAVAASVLLQAVPVASSAVVESLLLRLAPGCCRGAFGSAVDRWSFASQLRRSIEELELQAVTPAVLLGAAAKSAAAQCLAEVWGQLHTELALRGLRTSGQAVAAATDSLRRGLPRRFAAYDEVRLQGFWKMRPAQLRFAFALASRLEAEGKRLQWLLPVTQVQAADVTVNHLLRQIERDWQQLTADVRPEAVEGLAHLMNVLVGDVSVASAVEVVLPLHPYAEEREIARRVALLLEQGTPPESIAICAPGLTSEARQWADALAQHGVAARGARETPVGETPIGRFALEAAWLAERQFAADSLASVVASRYALPPDGLDVWRRFSQAGVVDEVRGADDEQGGVLNRLTELRDRSTSESERQAVQTLLHRCAAIIEQFRLPEQAPLEVFASRWWAALEAVGLRQAVSEGQSDDAVQLAEERLAFATLQDGVRDAREALRLASAGAMPVSRRLFLDWLEAVLQQPMQLPGLRAGAVWLLEPPQVAGARLTHVFLVRGEEGRWGREPSVGLLSESEQTELNRSAGMPLFRVSVGEGDVVLAAAEADARIACGLALGATEAVTFSVARYGSDGRPQAPSAWLTKLARAENVTSTVVVNSPVPRLEDCNTVEDFRRTVSRAALCPTGGASEVQPEAAALLALFEGESWVAVARHICAIERERLSFWADETRGAGAYSGALPPLHAAALTAFDVQRPASAKVLQAFAACHFRGFAGQWLHLSLDDVGSEDASRREVGTLWHAALQKTVPLMVERGLWQSPRLSAQDLRPMVIESVNAAAAEVARRRPVGHPLVWRLHVERSVDAVVSFLLREEAGLAHLTPHAMEAAFGGRASPLLLPPAFEGETPVALQGLIDRIDTGPDAQAVAVDYKRGRAGQLAERSAALLVTEFQLPLYAFALSRQDPSPQTVDAAWLGVRRKDQLLLSSVVAHRGGSIAALLDCSAEGRKQAEASGQPNLANAVHGLVHQLRQGDLGPRPKDCSFCEFASLCRIGSRKPGGLA
jgi:ATP-dependent helicase/nuclease subunit B